MLGCAAATLVTSAEVYQEILHRFVAIGSRDAITPTMRLLDDVVDEIAPVTHMDTHATRDLVLQFRGLSARDALHAAVMARLGSTMIWSFDAGFDEVPGIVRIRE